MHNYNRIHNKKFIFKVDDKEVLCVTPDQNLIYSSAEYFKMKIFNKALQQEKISFVVIKGDYISFIDGTAVSVGQTFLRLSMNFKLTAKFQFSEPRIINRRS